MDPHCASVHAFSLFHNFHLEQTAKSDRAPRSILIVSLLCKYTAARTVGCSRRPAEKSQEKMQIVPASSQKNY